MTIAANREQLDHGSTEGARWRGAAIQVIDGAGTARQLLAGESGALCLFATAAGQIYTLPVIGSDDIGMEFQFSVTVSGTSNSYTLNTGSAANFFGGSVVATSTTPGDEDVFAANLTDVALTLDADVDGRLAGGFFTATAVSSTIWAVGGFTVSTPAALTPWS